MIHQTIESTTPSKIAAITRIQKPAYWTGPASGTASHTGGGVEPEVGTLGMTGLLVGFADASLEHNPSSWNQLDGLCPVKHTSPVHANRRQQCSSSLPVDPLRRKANGRRIAAPPGPRSAPV